MNNPLWKHQQVGVDRAKNVSNFAFFFEAGTGKSRTTIEVLRHKFNQDKRIKRTLILCPPIVVKNWKDEWAKFSGVPKDKVICLTGTGKHRGGLIAKYGYRDDLTFGHIPEPRIFVTNYETLLMENVYAAICEWKPEIVILDEAHKVKSTSSKRSKLVDRLVNNIVKPRPEVFLLTGTPVLNNEMDLFMPYLIMDGGRTFGKNFFVFRAQYFYDKNATMPKDKYFPDWRIRPDGQKSIMDKIGESSMSAKKAECMDLPPLVRQTVKVEMAPKQRKMYEDMRKHLITFLDTETGKGPVVAEMALTKALRLMQISSGFVKDVDENEVEIDNPKESALKELLEELTPNHKVIVWAVFRKNYETIERVCNEIGVEYATVYGGMTDAKRNDSVKIFNNEDKCRVLIGNPASAGIGINLVASSYSIFYSRNFSLENDLQATARNYRGGSEIHEKITRIDLICENSIDEHVSDMLSRKEAISDKVFDYLRSEK